MAKSNYSDWVLKYKTKGVYINKMGDDYIGSVTKEDGFIPAKDKIKGSVYALEFGLYTLLSSLLKNVYHSLKTDKKHDSIMLLVMMNYIDNFDVNLLP